MDIKEIAKQLGSRGGQARAKTLSASRRKEIASKASNTRWGNAYRQADTNQTQSRYCLKHKVRDCGKCK